MDRSNVTLTPSEETVARLACAGLRNQEIAARLDRGLGTVKNQLNSAFRKLGVRNRVELVNRLAPRLSVP